MKEKMYSKLSNSLLHDHIIDGFHSTHEGLRNLKDQGIIKEDEYTQLLEQNIKRLITRVKEFRVAEKLICIFFAFMFTWLQMSVDEDLDMRRPSRTRTQNSRTVRGSRGGRSSRRDKDL